MPRTFVSQILRATPRRSWLPTVVTATTLLVVLPSSRPASAAPVPEMQGATANTMPDPARQAKLIGPGDHAFTIQVGDLDRHYTVHVPPDYDGKKPVPIVIMLHGGGGTGRGAATETGWSAKADREGFLAVYPEAMPPDPTRPSRFGRNGQVWNDGSGRFHSGEKNIDDVGFLNAMIDEIETRFAVDARRIFVTGFSNGASMTFRVGAELSQRIAAIAPAAGACWVDVAGLARPLSVCYITGAEDPLNPLAGGETRLAIGGRGIGGRAKPPVQASIDKWIQALACPANPEHVEEKNGVRTVVYGPGCDDTEVVFITIEGMGHTWAGGKSLLPAWMVGKTTDKLKATDVIWDFFVKHPAPAEQAKG